jgi:hypothetical protein
MTKLIINCETNEIIERQLNKAEKDQQKIDEIASANAQAEADAKVIQRQALLDRLGISADELKTILG